MHDLRLIREKPEAFARALARRGLDADVPYLLGLDARVRGAQTAEQERQAEANRLAKEIGAAMRTGERERAETLKARVAELKLASQGASVDVDTLKTELDARLAALPNVPADSVPDGADEAGNVLQHERGTQRQFDFQPAEHADFGPALGMDFENAARVSGARFAYLRGDLARLNRALGQFMLDLATRELGYEEVAPPLLVREQAAYETTQLPKFREDLFETTDGRFLIPTAEVSLTNLVGGQILRADELPLRFTALTPCFRSEAGAAGRDTRGFIRQHQFDKVELVSITMPDQSEAEHERMTQAAETVLDRLALPYRRMLLCTGDMGFQSRKTYDLEVWLPGAGQYREISSCSNCGDFQARRMNARYRPDGEKGTRFVHTLNGSALAVGRTLVAVLENYQEADGSVTIPNALKAYMGGVERLIPRA